MITGRNTVTKTYRDTNSRLKRCTWKEFDDFIHAYPIAFTTETVNYCNPPAKIYTDGATIIAITILFDLEQSDRNEYHIRVSDHE